MLLIGQYDSPFVRRAAIALTHYAIPYEHRPWSVWADAENLAKYNPLRRVPVLVLDDGEVLIESAAILDAADEMVSAERTLIPRSGAVRREILRVCAFAMGMSDKAVSLLYEGVLRKESVRSPVWIARCESQLRDTLHRLEAERVGRASDYWFGAFSHADIAITCALRFLKEAHPPLWTTAEFPALSAQAERCESMPLFKQIVQPLHVAV